MTCPLSTLGKSGSSGVSVGDISLLSAQSVGTMQVRINDRAREGTMAMGINVGCGMTPTKDWVNFDNSFSLRLARGGYLGVLVGALPLLTSPNGRSSASRAMQVSAMVARQQDSLCRQHLSPPGETTIPDPGLLDLRSGGMKACMSKHEIRRLPEGFQTVPPATSLLSLGSC